MIRLIMLFAFVEVYSRRSSILVINIFKIVYREIAKKEVYAMLKNPKWKLLKENELFFG